MLHTGISSHRKPEGMTVDQHDVIDIVSVHPAGDILLTISDHLPWDDINKHLFCLQEKVNAYLRFIESGEIYEKHPNAVGHPIVIDVVLKYAVPASAKWFLDKASATIRAAGFRFNIRCP